MIRPGGPRWDHDVNVRLQRGNQLCELSCGDTAQSWVDRLRQKGIAVDDLIAREVVRESCRTESSRSDDPMPHACSRTRRVVPPQTTNVRMPDDYVKNPLRWHYERPSK